MTSSSQRVRTTSSRFFHRSQPHLIVSEFSTPFLLSSLAHNNRSIPKKSFSIQIFLLTAHTRLNVNRTYLIKLAPQPNPILAGFSDVYSLFSANNANANTKKKLLSITIYKTNPTDTFISLDARFMTENELLRRGKKVCWEEKFTARFFLSRSFGRSKWVASE